MLKTARIGLIGCGAVSQLYYTPALKELERQNLLQLKALFDPSLESIEQLQKSFPNASPLSDLGELSAQEIDLAIIASPPRFHAEQTIQLLQKGISVLCEKPMAANVAEAEAMIETAVNATGVLAIGHFRRFFPATQTIKRILSLKMLGDIKSFTFAEGGNFRWPIQSPAYFKKESTGGGVLLDIGIHVLDLLVWWFGEPMTLTYEDDAMGGIEVNCQLKAQFAAGFTGEIRLSRDCLLPNCYIIEGTKGSLKWEVNEANRVEIALADSSYILNAHLHELEQGTVVGLGRESDNFEQSFIRQVYDVINAIAGQETLMVSGTEGIRSLRLIDHCYRHRSLMAMPWLSANEFKSAQSLNSYSEI
jgi:predicted dehydrogenase